MTQYVWYDNLGKINTAFDRLCGRSVTLLVFFYWTRA